MVSGREGTKFVQRERHAERSGTRRAPSSQIVPDVSCEQRRCSEGENKATSIREAAWAIWCLVDGIRSVRHTLAALVIRGRLGSRRSGSGSVNTLGRPGPHRVRRAARSAMCDVHQRFGKCKLSKNDVPAQGISLQLTAHPRPSVRSDPRRGVHRGNHV